MTKNEAIAFIAGELENGLDAFYEALESEHGGYEENYEGTKPVLELTLGDLLDSIEFRYRLNRILKRMQEKCKEFASSEDEESDEEDDDESDED